jgi:hypothetical protein
MFQDWEIFLSVTATNAATMGYRAFPYNGGEINLAGESRVL